MRIVCSYCRKVTGADLPRIEALEVTDQLNMCRECEEHFTRQWTGLSLAEYLDGFDVPTYVVHIGAGRIVAANAKFAELIGADSRDLYGLIGGEAMECLHSRKPGGCGKTVHCETCTIRQAVEHTAATGQPCIDVESYIERKASRYKLKVSTERVSQQHGALIRITIDHNEQITR